MNKNYDELYNKFVDGELTNQELEKINGLMESDEKFRIGLRSHKFVHNSLFDIPMVQAPVEITARIMGQIASSISEKYRKNYFFRVILAIFGISFLISIIMFVMYSGNLQNSSESFSLLELIKPYTKNIIPQISKILKSDLIKSIGGLLSFIILLVFYFTINEHKNFKDRINQF